MLPYWLLGNDAMPVRRTTAIDSQGSFEKVEPEGATNSCRHCENTVVYNDENAAYGEGVEAAKATCRQRRYCTYAVLVVYLVFIYLYLRRKEKLE